MAFVQEIAANAPGNGALAPIRRLPPPSDRRDKLDHSHLAAPEALQARLAELRQATEAHLRRSKAENTQRAYASDFAGFTLWCQQHQLAHLPAEADTVALYLSACAQADAAIATLRRRLVSISQAHKASGLPPPTESELVRRTLSGIARDLGSRPRQVAPLRLAALRAMLEATPEDDLIAVRDRAILLLGFAGGMRRSEISSLDVTDLSFVDQGVDILIRRSKTDQEGHGRTIGIPKGRHPDTCPVIALQRWLFLAALEQAGPLFPRIVPNGRPASRRPDNKGTLAKGRLSPQGIARVVQRAVARIGLDPKDFAGHSLRSGFATEAAAQGASERAIMRQTGHKSLEMVRRYIREGDRYRDNAASYLGL